MKAGDNQTSAYRLEVISLSETTVEFQRASRRYVSEINSFGVHMFALNLTFLLTYLRS
jgi:hypothetical protein